MSTPKVQSIWNALLGSEVKYFQGSKWRLRGIEAGQEHEQALILLHGTGGHCEAWAQNIKTLAKHFHVFALDLPYHGLSQKQPFVGESIVDQYVDALFDFIDTQKLVRPHLEGESLGGVVGIQALLRDSSKMGRVIVQTVAPVQWDDPSLNTLWSDPAGLAEFAKRSEAALSNPNKDTIRARMEWLMAPDKVTDEIVDVRYNLWADPEINASIRRVTHYTAVEPVVFQKYFHPKEVIQSIDHEVLVMWTDGNPGEGPDVGRLFHELVKNSEFYVINDAHHWPQWEQPEEHDAVTIEYLTTGKLRNSHK